MDAPRNIITPKKIDAFTAAMRDRLSNGPVEFRKAHADTLTRSFGRGLGLL